MLSRRHAAFHPHLQTKAKGDITTRKELFTWAKRPDERLPLTGVPQARAVQHGNELRRSEYLGGQQIDGPGRRRPVPATPPTWTSSPRNTMWTIETLTAPLYTWSTLMPLGANVNSPQGWEAQPSIMMAEPCCRCTGRIHRTRMGTSPWTFSCRRGWTTARGPAEQLPAPVNSPAQDKSFLTPTAERFISRATGFPQAEATTSG